jgi:hypothetical protein
MSQSRAPLLIAIVLAAGLGIALFQKHGALQRLQADHARLKAQLDAGAAELSLAQDQLNAANRNLDSAQRDREELVRLRGEVSQLRRATNSAVSPKKSSHPIVPAPSITDPPETRRLIATVKARIPANGLLVTGGWEIAPGRRALVLAGPVATVHPDGTVTIEVSTRIVDAPDSALTSLGLDLKSNDRSSAQQLFDADNATALIQALEATEGVDVLSAPRITTADGREAQIGMTRDGEEGATQIGLIPRLDPTDGSIELELSANLLPWPAPTP